MLNAKLSLKFYIVACLLLFMVIFGFYGIYFLNANEILLENNTPMDPDSKLILTIFMSVIVLSWTLSMLTVIRQIILGSAFRIDANGIHSTATATIVLAFIFVVPVKQIPYEAILEVSEENGILTVTASKGFAVFIEE